MLWNKPQQTSSIQTPESYFYYGQSMKGTFQFGDKLTIVQAAITDIVPGDIVICCRPDYQTSACRYVHRVMACRDGALVLRGDHNAAVDTTLVTQENMLGKVVAVTRNRKTRRVYGGLLGLLSARRFHVWNRATRQITLFIKRTSHYPYHLLRQSGLVKYVWRPSINRSVFQNRRGTAIRYIYKNQTVAFALLERKQLWFHHPFDLILWHDLRELMACSTIKTEWDFGEIKTLKNQ